MMKHAEEYFAIARERERIRRAREAGAPPPWTEDPIFMDWRFCNVRREDDRTTVWFRDNIRSHLKGWRVVQATAIFRWFNRIETGEALRDLLLGEWDTKEARRRLKDIKPAFTGAYIVRGPHGMSKVDGILQSIDTFRALAPPLHLTWGRSLQAAWADLRQLPMLGNFTAYEIVTDLRWTPVLMWAHDINTWASAGPGCARGLGYVVDGNAHLFNYTSADDQGTMLGYMRDLLRMSQDSVFWPAEWSSWEMREVEHWACETYKYIRCRDENQPPRQRFRHEVT